MPPWVRPWRHPGLSARRSRGPTRTGGPRAVQVGSIAKLFTAVLVHQLVAEGLLDLDAPVTAVLPEFRLADAAATAALTPRHLLSMTSGLEFGYYLDYG